MSEAKAKPAVAPKRKTVQMMDLLLGAVFQCVEGATFGLPLEVWKTRMARFRNEGNWEAFKNVYKRGGVPAYWAGFWPKQFESALKGAILMAGKESLLRVCESVNMDPTLSGFIAGAGGGISQTVLLAPCTFLVTGAVTGDKSQSTITRMTRILKKEGISGLYHGAVPVMFRQATNWALRQGCCEYFRVLFKKFNKKDEKLSLNQELLAGALGGAVACINQPFEVVRVEMQASGDAGVAKKLSMSKVFANIYKQMGIRGLFKGVFPRMLLSAYQTIFMVTFPKLIQPWMNQPLPAKKH